MFIERIRRVTSLQGDSTVTLGIVEANVRVPSTNVCQFTARGTLMGVTNRGGVRAANRTANRSAKIAISVQFDLYQWARGAQNHRFRDWRRKCERETLTTAADSH
jgi:hypothetical protein